MCDCESKSNSVANAISKFADQATQHHGALLRAILTRSEPFTFVGGGVGDLYGRSAVLHSVHNPTQNPIAVTLVDSNDQPKYSNTIAPGDTDRNLRIVFRQKMRISAWPATNAPGANLTFNGESL